MSQLVSCPHCKRTLQLPTRMHVPQMRCLRCKGIFALPTPRPTSAAIPVTRLADPPVPPLAATRSCPACRALLAPEALGCPDCGFLLGKRIATAPSPLPLPAPPPAAASTSPRLDFRHEPTVWRLLPAALLVLILLSFMIRDRFVGGEAGEAETNMIEKDIIELSVDPDPLLAIQFQEEPTHRYGTLRFGLTMLQEEDERGKHKRLIFAEDGDTNNALVRIDGETFMFGKFVFGRGSIGRKGDHSDFIADPWTELPILRGRWREAGKALGQDRTGRPRIGLQSVYVYDAPKIAVTQTVEIVPSEQIAVGQSKRRLDTCLVRYRIDNEDERAHRVAFRFVLDTFIGGNDGVPFTIPGARELCDTFRDFATPDSVPDFIQALEHPSLDSPGTVAHLTLRLGGGVEAPDRVILGRWIDQLKWQLFEKPHVDWQFPVRPMGDDSGVVLYWQEKELPAGGHRELGFAYGLGNVSSAESGGKLGLTVGGSFRPGEEFTVTAYVHEPLPHQMITLELPRGLSGVGDVATQPVPALPGDATSRNSPVSWKLKAARPGRYTLRVRTSNGLTQSQIVTITSKGIFD